MKELTKAEQQVMQYIWKLEKAFLKDIVDEFPEPKPAYTTVSTVVRVLVEKGFIKYKTYGKIREYYPSISKKEYSRLFFKKWISSFFNNSKKNFASFFMNETDMNITELEELRNMIEKEIESRKKNN